MTKLLVIIASTRPGRVGLPIGTWFFERATAHGKLEIELADLAEVGLPFFDEPKHPRLRQYQHEHTKKWSATVGGADAFVFVTPEYNFGMPATLKNAIDYLFHEWAYKPAGFVSYGGLSGGTRSVQMAKLVVSALKMMPIPENVNIAGFAPHMKEGRFEASEAHEKSATGMLDELLRWAAAMKTLRA